MNSTKRGRRSLNEYHRGPPRARRDRPNDTPLEAQGIADRHDELPDRQVLRASPSSANAGSGAKRTTARSLGRSSPNPLAGTEDSSESAITTRPVVPPASK